MYSIMHSVFVVGISFSVFRVYMSCIAVKMGRGGVQNCSEQKGCMGGVEVHNEIHYVPIGEGGGV
jgi:hypothetical protein